LSSCLLLAVSAANGGNLIKSQPDLVKKCKSRVKINKLVSGKFYTENDQDESIGWTNEELKNQSLILQFDEEDMSCLIEEFHKPQYRGTNGGRAMQFWVTAKAFFMDSTGTFYCTVQDAGDFDVPKPAALSTAEQKRLALERQQQNRNIRSERISLSAKKPVGRKNTKEFDEQIF
jgi:hypothetical protein